MDLGWTTSKPRESGDKPLTLRVRCAKCKRERLLTDLVQEQNTRSAAYGKYVCHESHTIGGCYDGPYPDDSIPNVADDYSPFVN